MKAKIHSDGSVELDGTPAEIGLVIKSREQSRVTTPHHTSMHKDVAMAALKAGIASISLDKALTQTAATKAKRTGSNAKWTKKEEKFIRDNCKKKASQIARLLNKYQGATIQKIWEMGGLRKMRKHLNHSNAAKGARLPEKLVKLRHDVYKRAGELRKQGIPNSDAVRRAWAEHKHISAARG